MDDKTKPLKVGGAQPIAPSPNTTGLAPKTNTAHKQPGASAWSPQQRTQEIARVNADIAAKQGKPTLPTPAGAVGQMPKIGAKTDGAKKFSIMDRLRGQASQIGNTLGKLGKQIQTKAQGSMKMPGINKSELDEMIDLLKGQMSKLGKPGLSDQAKAGAAQWLASQGKIAPKPVAPVQAAPVQAPPQAAPAQVAPAQLSRMKKKPQSPKVDAAHEAAHSQHSHNKIKENMKRVLKPAEQPKVDPQPTPAQHAVKSPENARAFQSKNVIPKEKAPPVQSSGVAPAKPSAKVIPGNSPKAQQAVAAHQKRQFESEKTAPFAQPKDDGWGSPAREEATQEPTRIAQKPVAGQPKAAAPSDKTVNVKVGQKQAAPAQVQSAPAQAQAAPAKPAVAPVADPKAMEATQIMPRDKHGMPVKELGVKKPFAPEEAHSKLLTFLHNLVHPGNALGRHSQHFMGKSEEFSDEIKKGISDHLVKLGQAMGVVAKRPGVSQGKVGNNTFEKDKYKPKLKDMKTSGSYHLPGASEHKVPKGAAKKVMGDKHMPKKVKVTKAEEMEKKSPTEEQTEKDSLASTSMKIQTGAKKELPKEKAKLLTDPKNYPEHNRKRLHQLIGKQCGDMNKK